MASIRKREWEWKGETKSSWVVDYKDQDGKRRLKSFDRKKDADGFRTKAEHEVARGVHTADSASITVSRAAEIWLERAKTEGLEAATALQYRQHVTYHINPLIGETKLSKLTAPSIREFLDKLMAGGWKGPNEKGRQVKQGPRSRTMARKVLTSLKSIVKEAQGRGYVSQNVAREVTLRIDKRQKKKLRVGVDIPNREEIKTMLGAVEGRWRPLLLTAIFTGLRASELRGLSWPDVDFDTQMIHVRQRADRFNQIGPPKSEAGDRKVPMSPIVVNTLREWKLQCPKGELDLVFPNGNGNVEGLSNIFKRGLAPLEESCDIVDGEGKPKYSMHAFRHFYASWLINRKREGGLELAPKRVQERLGHSTITMTLDVYGHLFPEGDDELEELAQAEAALLS